MLANLGLRRSITRSALMRPTRARHRSRLLARHHSHPARGVAAVCHHGMHGVSSFSEVLYSRLSIIGRDPEDHFPASFRNLHTSGADFCRWFFGGTRQAMTDNRRLLYFSTTDKRCLIFGKAGTTDNTSSHASCARKTTEKQVSVSHRSEQSVPMVPDDTSDSPSAAQRPSQHPKGYRQRPKGRRNSPKTAAGSPKAIVSSPNPAASNLRHTTRNLRSHR